MPIKELTAQFLAFGRDSTTPYTVLPDGPVPQRKLQAERADPAARAHQEGIGCLTSRRGGGDTDGIPPVRVDGTARAHALRQYESP